jgi:hypothetical protein
MLGKQGRRGRLVMLRIQACLSRTRYDLRSVLVCMAMALGPAGAQETPRAQPEPPVAAPAPAPQPGAPGPFGTIGQFIDESLQGLGQRLKDAREQVDDVTGRAGNAAKDAAGSINVRRPSVVAGRERCLPARNGAPDCVTATTAMCKASGFETGSSIDMQTEQRCPAATPSGPASPPLDESQCWLESYVIRALCR